MDCQQMIIILLIGFAIYLTINTMSNDNIENFEIPKENTALCSARCQTNSQVAELLRTGQSVSGCVMDCIRASKDY